MSVNLNIHYIDQSGMPSHVSAEIQKYRNAEIYKSMYKVARVPKFPVVLRKFVGIKFILEDFSRFFPQACFCFTFDNKCLVLNEGCYSVYDSYEDAVRDIYQ